MDVNPTRTRVWVALPLSDKTEAIVPKVISYFATAFTACTYTRPARPAAWLGQWWDKKKGVSVPDEIVIVTADVKSPEPTRSLNSCLERLKIIIESREDLAWITLSQIVSVEPPVSDRFSVEREELDEFKEVCIALNCEIEDEAQLLIGIESVRHELAKAAPNVSVMSRWAEVEEKAISAGCDKQSVDRLRLMIDSAYTQIESEK